MIVLLVNDHLLKQVWPGFVTGKLSDVAGLLVAPPLLALVFLRRADLAATAVTGILFALVKTTETGAEAASHVWTFMAGPSRVLDDPTDLLALPALALAWWVRRRSLAAPSTAPSTARARVLLTMPLAVLAVTATSAAPGPPAAVSVEVRGERVVVRTDASYAWETTDRGATWTRTGSSDDAGRARSAMCVPYQATRCYRVTPGRLAVEQSDDGSRTWGPAWSPSADDRDRLSRQFGDRPLASSGLAVQAWRGGHVIVVANGLDGILLRDEHGSWRRLGWPGEQAPPLDLGSELTAAIFLAGCVLFGAAGAGLRRYHRAYLGFAAATCLSVPVVAFSDDPAVTDALAAVDGLLTLLRLLAVLMIPAGLSVCVALLFAGRARPAPVAVGVLSAPLVYLAVYTPFEGWAGGAFATYWTAVAVAALLTALVLAVDVILIRRDAAAAGPPADGRADPGVTWRA
ncbi:hypothetical protein MF672_011500 [Actinomadura sp. ATCC 31491]|uniref:Uncharacterized protein n=1 Tax=Actinomadura luzonensis TaxID=2805427 RepID=A0ABT0FR57_9ACTN|nr:hypothetical protein [Actinomadura luzonensis]MCK2214411.1 hypothetical protein [Actinomadura luzonensis]